MQLLDVPDANNGTIVNLCVSFHRAIEPKIEVPVDAACVYVLTVAIRDTKLGDLFSPNTEGAGLRLNNSPL